MSLSTGNRVSAGFPAHGSSVADARRFVRSALRRWALDELVDDALLLVSELVTNAVVHAGTVTEVTCTRRLDGVQIDVTDRYPGRWLPLAPPQVGDDSEGGRGLALAAALAASWGVAYTRAGKRVWFVLTAQGAEPEEPFRAAEGVATVELDRDGRVAGWDEAATELLGRPPEDAVGRSWAQFVTVAPGDPAPAELLARPRWQGGYSVSSAHLGSVAVFASHVAVADDRIVCVLVPRRAGAPAAPADGPEGLDLPEAAGLRLTLDVLVEQLVERACELLGGDAGFALVTNEDDDELVLRAGIGLGAVLGPGRRLPQPLPAADEGARQPSAWLEPARYPGPGPAGELLARAGLAAAVTVPLLVADRIVGVLGVAARDPDRFTAADPGRLARAAASAAASVQVARVIEVERRQRGRLSFLAEASELLAGTLEREMTLALLGQLVVPRLAPWCAVYEVDPAGAARLAYAWHTDEEQVDELRARLAGLAPPSTEAAARRWSAAGEAGPATVLPLLGRGRAVGTLVLGSGPDGRLARDVLELAEDLSRRAGLALDNALLYSERTATAQAFQRNLLPPELPAVPGTDIGVAYQAAGSGNEVGGDFYDVFRLGDGRWGFAIGDVCGKGPEAAAVTGLARQTMRLLGQEAHPVPAVLSRLNHAILQEGPRSRFITVVSGSLTPTADGVELSLVCAGHPLPLLLGPDGTVHPVGTPQPLLGVLDEVEYEPDTVLLKPGDTLVCVTDEVTERRSGHGMFGEEGLVAVLRRCGGRTAPEVAAEIHRSVMAFGPEPARDDLAVLVLRAGAATEPVIHSSSGRSSRPARHRANVAP